MIVYGRQPVRELLAARRRPVERVWATSGAADEVSGVEVEITDADAISMRAGSDGHQGICAQTTGYPYVGAGELLAPDEPFLVALDEVQDPQNLGAIARTAECAGATGLVLPERRSAEVTPAACKASAGAVEHLRIARVRNLADFLADAKALGCWCYGAAAEGKPYTQVDYAGGLVLVLGAEGKGLRPRVAKACDELVALPIRGRVASLNVSAAAAALMYGILQGKPSP
ncbi:MAG: 23S rRNA (guanosine(2251)-2'-O)-methyltransferase RlmB [Solirubrobacteraceae bacterium]